ncbi:fosfomycin resistance protein FosB [Stieleria maiorica]|uniref:Fosfomycin resistance protein FosB n=1 Tax=Stieleria maiorica TaxID=2795974 RepID=A0A5B9MGP0_9BACT|nr:VOC family protein [Stieleria maiorica]QEF98227.1 fosfomycin resistance protein FosB [Stieleria maiorica]
MTTPSPPTKHATSAIGVKAIDHVTIVVHDLSRSRDFYRDLLGMEEVERPDFGFPGHWLQAGATQVHLIETMEGTSEPGGGLDPDRVTSGLTHHFAFEVEDAIRAHRILESAGVRIQGGPRKRPDGCMQLWFYDPDGHCVEVFDRTGSAASH